MRTLVKDLEELEELDYEENNAVKKVLRNIHSDILFWSKTKNARQLTELARFLRNFASINSNGLYQNRKKRDFITELLRLARQCDS